MVSLYKGHYIFILINSDPKEQYIPIMNNKYVNIIFIITKNKHSNLNNYIFINFLSYTFHIDILSYNYLEKEHNVIINFNKHNIFNTTFF